MTTRLTGYLFRALAYLILPVAFLASRGLAPLFILASLVSLGLIVGRWRDAVRPRFLALTLVALVVLCALSAIWSMTPGETLRTTLSLAGTAIGGLALLFAASLLDDMERDKLYAAIVYGGAIGFALLAVELATDGIILRSLRGLIGRPVPAAYNYRLSFNSGMAIAAIFLWPWALAAWRRYSAILGILAFAGGLIVLWFGQSDAPTVAIIGGIVVFAIVAAVPRHITKVAIAGLVVIVVAMPALPGALPNPLVSTKKIEFLSNSALHRLVIWRNAVKHIKRHPVIGSGFDTSRALYAGTPGVVLRFSPDEPDRTWVNKFQPIPLHPHNGVLQVWLELGAVGAAISLALLIAIARAIERHVRDRWQRAFAYAAFSTALFIAMVSFGIWQAWWLAGLFLLAGLFTAALNPRRPGQEL